MESRKSHKRFEILEHCDDDLLRIAAENLSTASTNSVYKAVKSGIRFLIDTTEGDSRRLHVVETKGPFTESRLIAISLDELPGSYFLREPIQHMTDFLATDQDGNT